MTDRPYGPEEAQRDLLVNVKTVVYGNPHNAAVLAAYDAIDRLAAYIRELEKAEGRAGGMPRTTGGEKKEG